MRVICCKRAEKIAKKEPSPTPKAVASPSSPIDEEFISRTIDTRAINLRLLPDAPAIQDEDDLSLPLTMLVSHTPEPIGKGARKLDEIRQILDIGKAKSKPKESHYRLSQNLEPPPIYHFCPEIAFAERCVAKNIQNNQPKQRKNVGPTRQFPTEIITRNLLPSVQSTQPQAVQSRQTASKTFIG